MTVIFNEKKQNYTIFNKKETIKDLVFSRMYRNTYFQGLGISVFKNIEEEKIVLVLTKHGGRYTPKIYALSLKSWRRLDDALDNLNDISALDSMIERFF